MQSMAFEPYVTSRKGVTVLRLWVARPGCVAKPSPPAVVYCASNANLRSGIHDEQ